MHLLDTNIFLEILLDQDQSDLCRHFLNDNLGTLHLSDFSLHSIGVILLRRKAPALFRAFLDDTLPNVTLLGLTRAHYPDVATIAERHGLDFDDAYQCAVAATNGLRIVTFDADFERVSSAIPVTFLGQAKHE